jgi:type II secretory pathway predicted ATPase ExeA
MYESFYHFREKPFSLLPDPDFLYLGGRYKTALSLLEYGIWNQAGFIVITGETGTGKTTLLRKVLAETQEECTVGIMSHTHGELGSLMPWILMVFGLTWKGRDGIELFQAFSEFLVQQSVQGRRVILIVDEAQNLSPPMLEELRLLSNMNADKHQVLQIILSGQPGLRTLLQRQDLAQFAQRVAVDYTLEAMDEVETQEYIQHRLTVAGGDHAVFSAQACRVVYQLTGGMPRLINQVCDLALAYGCTEEAPRISGRLVAEAARDRSAGCILPLRGYVDLAALADEPEVRPLPVNGRMTERATMAAAKPEPFPQKADPPVRPDPLPNQPVRTEAPLASREQEAATPESLFQRAQILRKKGRSKDAVRLLAQAAQDPAFAFKATAEAGACYREIGRPDLALDAFRKALADKTAPKSERVAVCYDLGRTYQAAGKSNEALECYRKVHRVDPSFQDVAIRIERLSGEKPASPATLIDASYRDHGSFVGQAWRRLQRLLRVG